jgi:hypothetical protein
MLSLTRACLASAFLLAVLPACDLFSGRDKCGSGKPEPYFDVQGMQLVAYQQNNNVLISANSVVNLNELRFRLYADVRYYSQTKTRSTGFLPAAMACSPIDPGYKGSTERIDSLTITSRFDYDAQHPAGTALNDVLAVNYTPTSLREYLLNNEGKPEQHIYLTLGKAPTRAGSHQFVLRYRQTNGEIYTAETPVFTLRP